MKIKISLSTIIVIIIQLIFVKHLYSQNVEFDKRLGKQNSKSIETEMGIYSHKQTGEYISSIGNRLVDNMGPRFFYYNFHVVEMSEPNAFALPGGYIYISRGLLCLANTEDEIAGILGHEIIHSEYRHSVKQMKGRIIPGLLQIPGEIVGFVISEDLGQLINTPINRSNSLFLASYSRKHEKQADKHGMTLMAKSGYDPSHFPAVLDNLTTLIEEITGQEEEFNYFSSHPYTPKRVEYLNKKLDKLSYEEQPNIAETRKEFLQKLNGIYVGNNPKYGVFNENNFLHPELDLFLTFPKGWVTDNRPTIVGAIDTTDNQSMLVLGVAPEQKSPEELGKEFVGKLKQYYQVEPERAETVEVNSMQGYIVTINDNSSGKVYGIHNFWFRLNNITYQALGVAEEADFELLRKAAQSIRPLTSKEKETIVVHRLRIREAREGESLESFNKRTGNLWDVNVTAIMNNIDADEVLTKGQLLKIVLAEKYMSSTQ